MRCVCVAAVLFVCPTMLYAEGTYTIGGKTVVETTKPATVKDIGVTPEEAKEGFVSLFDGKTHNGWVGDLKGYPIEHGTMVCHGKNIFTKKEYANFVLRFEFKLSPGGNNGVALRAPLEGTASYTGMEIQVLDDGHAKYKGWLKPWQVHGSVYGVVPAKHGFLKPTGNWNEQEIVADGSRIKVTVNGTVVNDVDLSKVKPIDGHAHPGLHNAKGRIGWLGHGDPVAFRNVRIKELP